MTTFLGIAGSALVLSCCVVPTLAAGTGRAPAEPGISAPSTAVSRPASRGPLGAPNNPHRPTAEETKATPRNTTPPDPKP